MKQFKQFAVKQFPATRFPRFGKPEEHSDETESARIRVEEIKTALQTLCKKIDSGGGSIAQNQDPAAMEKRLKKIPLYTIGLALEEGSVKDENSLFKYMMHECGGTAIYLAKEIAKYDVQVEQLVLAPFKDVLKNEFPSIEKSKKYLAKCVSDRDAANSRYQSALRQIEQHPNFHPSKVSQAKLELEDADAKAENAQDNFAIEMFKLLSKEANFATLILEYIELQKAYHESASHFLKDIIFRLQDHITKSMTKPVFGFPIEDHLRVTKRTIAYPIELCVCTLVSLGLEEEGLLRIAGSNTRTKRMKLSLDAGFSCKPLPSEYRDIHVIAGVLKSYLRELPEPLLTHSLYEAFVQSIVNNATEENRMKALWNVIHQLPESNFNNLRYLIKFLSLLSKNCAVNKMTPSNIAIVIAPNLLRCEDDGNLSSLNVIDTSTINCVVELLIKHADWFFKDDIDFFMTFTKEELLAKDKEQDQTSDENQSSDSYQMTKSMGEYNNNTNNLSEPISSLSQRHFRGKSDESSLILVENEFKKSQSPKSSSENSSPPPEVVAKRKNKPVAPAPPSAAIEKNKNQPYKQDEKDTTMLNKTHLKEDVSKKNDLDRPDRPPRPLNITGVQTINRSTYKSRHQTSGNHLNLSRENLFNAPPLERRSSFDGETRKPTNDNVIENVSGANNLNESMQQKVVDNKMISLENAVSLDNVALSNSASTTTGSSLLKQVQTTEFSNNIGRGIKPVAAPRTHIPSVNKPEPLKHLGNENTDVQLRVKKNDISLITSGNKPAIPERPPALRPSSFRNSTHKNPSLEMLNTIDIIQKENSGSETTLERIHVYNVDKQQPTIIQVNNTSRLSDPTILSPEEVNKPNVQRTNSTGSDLQSNEGHHYEPKALSSQMRKLSQSESNILDVPPSPKPYHKIPRPQIPAPPPPIDHVPQVQPTPVESTNL